MYYNCPKNTTKMLNSPQSFINLIAGSVLIKAR
jgi:hypothetical protein